MKSFDAGAFKPSVPTPNKVVAQTSLFSDIMSNVSLRWFGAGISLLLFVAVISLSYSLGIRDVEKGAVPIIVSDNTPVKVRPQNPGGKQFPYQDMSVYQSLSDKKPETEKNIILTDAPERPTQYSPAEKIALEGAASIHSDNGLDDGATTDISLVNNVQEKPTAQFTALVKEPAPQKPTVNQIIQQNIAKQAEKEKAPRLSEKKEVVTQQPAQLVSLTKKPSLPAPVKKVTAAASKPMPYLQVGAYRSEAEAKRAWSKISGKYSSVLGTNKHVIMRADLKNKGTFYRLRVGPYNNKNKAVNICNSLKARSQGCMFIQQ